MQAVPAHRRQDLIYFNVPDPTQPFGYNPLKHVREDKISLAASGRSKLRSSADIAGTICPIGCCSNKSMFDHAVDGSTSGSRLLRKITAFLAPNCMPSSWPGA